MSRPVDRGRRLGAVILGSERATGEALDEMFRYAPVDRGSSSRSASFAFRIDAGEQWRSRLKMCDRMTSQLRLAGSRRNIAGSEVTELPTNDPNRAIHEHLPVDLIDRMAADPFHGAEGLTMKTVALVNMKGGVAKTTLATNLAHCLAQRHKQRVLLVDIDPQFNATQCILSGPDYVRRRAAGGHTILHVFDDAQHTTVSPVHGSISRTSIKLEDIAPWPTSKGFDLIPGDLELYRLDMGAGQGREQRLRRFLEKIDAVNKYDFVLIDTPPTPSAWMMSALLASDAYLVPVKPEPLSTVGIDLLRGVINRCSENHGHEIACLGVVLTSVDERTRVFEEAKIFLDGNAAWKGKRFAAHLPHRTRIARNQGRQIMILGSDVEDAKLALSSITNQFLERIQNV